MGDHDWPNFGLRLLLALGTGLGALAWSAVVVLVIWLVFRHLNPGEKPPAFPTPAVAVWFAPATVLILDFSALQVMAGLAIAVGTSRLLCMPSAIGSVIVPAPARHFVLALFVGFGVEAAGVAFVLHYHYRAAALIVLTTAVLVALIIGRGAWTSRPGHAARRRWAVALAMILLVAILARPVPGPGGHTGTAAAEAAGPSPGKDGGGTETELSATAGVSLPGPYSGVILWPEVQPVTLLIDPMLVGRGALASATKPLTIPFGGEYWMYRAPFQRPPRHSYFKRGTPVVLHFETTDRAQLQMEARQKLTRLLSTHCCGRVEVSILNADKYPGTLSLELSLHE